MPAVKNQAWVRNPIDSFVLSRLEREGLEPSPAANSNTLLRRMSLDLVGLPPSLEELAAFERDGGEQAYHTPVERLLASPHYGERWGRIWLDAARYADSDGFEKDKPRFVWMYRDWIINALNRDLPYNQFVVEQIAGFIAASDAGSDGGDGISTELDDHEEGGIDPEQFRMEAMYDRMDAIGKGILGLTIQCAQCHSHKYDPLTQTEYYRMFAFLNNCHEAQVTVYTRAQQDEWKATERLIQTIEDRLRSANPDWRDTDGAWEENVRQEKQPAWTVVKTEHLDQGGQKYYELGGWIDACGRLCADDAYHGVSGRRQAGQDFCVSARTHERSGFAAWRTGAIDLRHLWRSLSFRSMRRHSTIRISKSNLNSARRRRM